MKKITILKILVICILSIMIFSININSYAIEDILNAGSSFIQEGESEAASTVNKTNLKTISNTVYSILFIAAVAVAVVVAAVLGIQFMLGSMEEKAKIKEALYPFIIGCICVFGAFGIWSLAASVFKDI